MELIIIRHAQTRSNAVGSWHGQQDEGISIEGRRESEGAGHRLRRLLAGRITRVLSSDLCRALETADILAAAIGVSDVMRERQLRERDMGQWSGRSPAEVETLWPGYLDAWVAGLRKGPPGGETDMTVARRALQALVRRCRGQSGLVLVVTHAGVIRSLRVCAGWPNDPVPHLGGYWAWFEHPMADLRFGGEVMLGNPAAQPIT